MNHRCAGLGTQHLSCMREILSIIVNAYVVQCLLTCYDPTIYMRRSFILLPLTYLHTKVIVNMISMSIVPPLTTARINPTVSLDDKPTESDSTSPVVCEKE